MYDLLINLLASAIWFIFGCIATKLYAKIHEKGKSKILAMYAKEAPLAVCMSTRNGPLSTSSPRTSIAEVDALAKIIPVWHYLKVSYQIITSQSADVLNRYNNIIAIGGPVANNVTQALLDKYKNFLPVKVKLNPAQFEVGEKTYSPEYSHDTHQLIADYALIVAVQESAEIKKSSILVFGCRGYGTQGGVQSLIHRKLIKKKKRYIHSFMAIIRVDCTTENYSPSIKEFYPLQIE